MSYIIECKIPHARRVMDAQWSACSERFEHRPAAERLIERMVKEDEKLGLVRYQYRIREV